MAMGKKRDVHQDSLFIPTASVARSPGHPFYENLNRIFAAHGFDDFAEAKCEYYYAQGKGRPSIPPGTYFRMLMIGYFEGIASERGIAWEVADRKSLGEFLGYNPTEETPDHSSLSRIRHRLPLEVHLEIFSWVLKILAREKLLKGKTVAVDATTLEANAAMRSIIRRDTGESYRDFLTKLVQATGNETPTTEDLQRFDKKRKNKASNKDWKHPDDPDARVAKMKDGSTHLAHKAEHVVDLETNAIVAVTLPPADEGDTETMPWSLLQAALNLEEVAVDEKARKNLHDNPLSEVVADKGYHSNNILKGLSKGDVRSYISEPDRGQRKWKGDHEARDAVYANRRRIKGERGERLRKLRAERVERGFAHAYETGGMRRVHLRGSGNILKRLLIHAAALNLGLLVRKVCGAGTPRGLADLARALRDLLFSSGSVLSSLKLLLNTLGRYQATFSAVIQKCRAWLRSEHPDRQFSIPA